MGRPNLIALCKCIPPYKLTTLFCKQYGSWSAGYWLGQLIKINTVFQQIRINTAFQPNVETMLEQRVANLAPFGAKNWKLLFTNFCGLVY